MIYMSEFVVIKSKVYFQEMAILKIWKISWMRL